MNPAAVHSDERGGYLGKSMILIVVIFLAFGLVVIDGGSIIFAKLSLQQIADAAAADAAATYRDHPDEDLAYRIAKGTVEDRDDGAELPLKLFIINPDNGNVQLTVKKTANTFVLKYIGPLKQWTEIKASATQAPPNV